MPRLLEPVVQAIKAQGKRTVPVPSTGRISTSVIRQAAVNPMGTPRIRKPTDSSAKVRAISRAYALTRRPVTSRMLAHAAVSMARCFSGIWRMRNATVCR